MAQMLLVYEVLVPLISQLVVRRPTVENLDLFLSVLAVIVWVVGFEIVVVQREGVLGSIPNPLESQGLLVLEA